MVYVPVIPGVGPEYLELPDRYEMWYEDVKLVAEDGTKVHGWMIKPGKDLNCKGPTVLFFQENAGNISHRLQNVYRMIQKLHCNVFILSYRGYGQSEGKPSEAGIKQDAQAALDHLLERSDIDTTKIAIFGRSLGGAVAAWLASENPTKICCVLLENTFLSIPALAPCLLPLLGWALGYKSRPLNWIIKSPWKGSEFVANMLTPVLFLSAGKDEMIPQWHMRELFKLHRSPRSKWMDFPNGKHMDMWLKEGEKYWTCIYDFLKTNGSYPN
eukprot:CAMPEP_0196572420 /NCGR_PEP_ID=MMETSP1081-20130531/2483_1 /TAXON_ID=36882 /ORGANISM="Pyramimonas amylifera, Strain CCMP720" /LENGTH=269 /DNA_ID=CAMNT_0041889743 /DNA_START=222 /DNA_END=1031 /DNA_ORIENTATION=+